MKKTQSRNMKKRILSAALAMGMVLTMLPSDGIEAAAKKVVSNAATGDVTYEYSNYSNTKDVIRERKALKDTSVTGVITDASKDKGSVENPFVILEVTPQKDYSSIGYLVDGCEPMNMDSLRGNELFIDTLTDCDGDFFGFGKFTKPAGNVYFFPDEEEGDVNFYQNTNVTGETVTVDGVDIAPRESALRFTTDQWNAKEKTALPNVDDKILGYYEVVPKGDGKFVLKIESTTDADGNPVTTRSIVKADSSNQSEATLIWHTMNSFEINQVQSEGYNTNYMFLAIGNLNNDIAFPMLKIDLNENPDYVGNRFYTERIPSATDPYHDVTGDFYVYQSYDLFAKNTLGLSDAQAKRYSIAVKTITPYELSQNQAWVDIADLIYFNADLTIFKDEDDDGVKDKNEAGLIDLWQSKGAVGKEYMNRFHYGNSLNGDDPDPIKGFRGMYDYDHIPKLGPSENSTLRDEANYLNKSRELTLDVFYKILTRVTKSENYVAVIFDQNCTDPDYNDTKAGITYYRYRLGNSQAERAKIDGGYGATGYRTNVAKLWLACTSANPGLVQRFMIDGSLDAAGNGTDPKGQLEVVAGSGIIKYKANSRPYPGRSEVTNSDNAREYWSGYTFYCAEDKIAGDVREAQKQWDYWEDYAGEAEHDEDCYYVQGHVFVTPYGTNLVDGYTKVYSNSALNFADDRYLDFNDFLGVYGGSVSTTADKATSSLATKYIVDADHYVNYYLNELTVLDIEPSVKMKASNTQLVGERAYEWVFGYKDVYTLIPKRMGTDTRVKKIEHEVMQAFVAKNEDLNSTYDLIYIGDDVGGLWTGQAVRDTYGRDKQTCLNDMSRTDFVDNEMDGWVYFHIGDILNIADDYKNSSGFLSGDSTSKTITRQSGNDLTNKKMAKLVDYLHADYPIVIADKLYNRNLSSGEKTYVDPNSVMHKFLTDYDPFHGLNAATGKWEDCYYTKKMLSQIDTMISNRMKGKVTIVSGPTIYDSADLAHSYLSAPDGYAVLNFVVDVPNTTDYKYRVFIDRNRDSNFTYNPSDDEKNEVITSGYIPLTRLHNTLSIPMPDKWVGFVQWRIEVVNKNNEAKRYSLEGCSAVAADPTAPANSDRAKKKIVALQIMPTHNSSDSDENAANKSKSWVDLSNKAYNGKLNNNRNGSWQYLYSQVQDFDIDVVKITWRQFMQLFKPAAGQEKFSFKMGDAINITDDATSNPKKSVLERVEKTPIAFNNLDDATLLNVASTADNYYKLEDFNMIVLGFDDAYGFTDMSNMYGNVEYLYYFALKGCSILFTHDTTSQWSDPSKSQWNTLWSGKSLKDNSGNPWYEVRRFGYTGNTMMREIMGMNRYMKYSSNLTTDTNTYVNFRSGLAADIKKYVDNNITYDTTYDTANKNGLHGFSLYNLLRYACGGAGKNNGKEGRTQNKYMAIRPSDNNKFDNGGAFTIGGNTLTEVVSRINEGQITQYPFTIVTGSGANKSTQFKIGKTHGQWWQLNMEDEDLTVWYTLDDPYVCNVSDVNANNYEERKSGSQENCLMYSAVPYDAANNFYIFSKGNIFYSGVGHSNVGSEEEKKLFVNTLVAAYRPKYGLPFVQVTSSEASLIKNAPRTYGVTIPIDYAYNADGSINMANSEIITGGTSTDFIDGNYIYVKFRAMDNNGCSTIYTSAHIAKADGTADTDVIPIYSSLTNSKNNSPMTVSKTVDGKGFYELTVGDEYYIRFSKSNLNTTKYRVLFESYNNRVTTGEMDKTYVEFKTQPLFNLD